MKTLRIWTVACVVSAVGGTAASIQQQPWGFSVWDANGRPILIAQLQRVPYKFGTEPSAFWNLDGTKTVRDKDGKVISGFGFYGWTEEETTRVAVIARVPPEGAENKFYSIPELVKGGLKPRLELLATYALKPGETKVMDELKSVGAESASVRIETERPAHFRIAAAEAETLG